MGRKDKRGKWSTIVREVGHMYKFLINVFLSAINCKTVACDSVYHCCRYSYSYVSL